MYFEEGSGGSMDLILPPNYPFGQVHAMLRRPPSPPNRLARSFVIHIKFLRLTVLPDVGAGDSSN